MHILEKSECPHTAVVNDNLVSMEAKTKRFILRSNQLITDQQAFILINTSQKPNCQTKGEKVTAERKLSDIAMTEAHMSNQR